MERSPHPTEPDIASSWVVPGVPSHLQETLDALGDAYLAAFNAQFTTPPPDTHAYYQTSRLLRGALADFYWPGPVLRRRAPITNHELTATTQRLRSLIPQRAASPAPERLAIPASTPELERAWLATPRTRPFWHLTTTFQDRGFPAGVTPILFGSLAGPPPWPAYADVDIALYIPEHALDDTPALLECTRRYRALFPALLAVDPLQHHGPYILLSTDLPHYPPSLLPPATLRRAVTLYGGPLDLAIAPLAEDRLFSLVSLAALWRGLRDLAARPARSFSDRYTAKYFSSMALLAPALFCGCLGRPVDKAESFEIFKAVMDPASIATIEGFEALRRDWRWPLSLSPFLLAPALTRAHWLARTLNRWPSRELAARLRPLATRVDPLFVAMLERLSRETKGAAR